MTPGSGWTAVKFEESELNGVCPGCSVRAEPSKILHDTCWFQVLLHEGAA